MVAHRYLGPTCDRESSNGVVMAEKILRELRNRSRHRADSPPDREASADEQESPTVATPAPSPVHAVERWRSTRHEVDDEEGMRLRFSPRVRVSQSTNARRIPSNTALKFV